MKKKFLLSLFVALVSLGTWLNVQAAELRGFVKQFTNEQARGFVQQPNGRFSATQPSWNQAAYLNRVGVTVQAADGTVVYSGETATTTGGVGGYFSVPSLPVGTYTVTLTANGLTALPFAVGATVQPQMVATVELTTDSEIKNLNWILASQSKRILALSKRGTFPGGTADVDQVGNPVNYRIWYQGGDVASLYTQNGVNYVYFKGALFNDTIGLYSSALTEPTLSAAEKAYGWEFKGWRINQSDAIFSSEEVGNTRITSDITLEAVFEAPTYTVSFATDEEKGSINGQPVVSYTVEGNGSPVTNLVAGNLPVATAKPGYTFLGWYVDQTTNLVDNATILSTLVQKDLVYYAKYKKDAPAISIGANGNWYIDGVDTGKPSQGPAGQNAQPLTITSTSLDADGNTVITFSDNSQVTVKKGKDAQALTVVSTSQDPDGNTLVTFSDGSVIKVNKGKDGQAITIVESSQDANGNTIIRFSDNSTILVKKGQDATAPKVEIGANGNWFINGQDTGKPAQGAKGQDGQNGQNGQDGKSVTILESKLDADGNTLIRFSDGSTITIQKGKDAQIPQIQIGANGNWFINGVDSGKPSQGAKGQNGQSITVLETKLDANGNTIVTFSDGSSVTIQKGADAQAPRIHIGANGNWFINDVDTGKPAQGANGQNGQDGKSVSILETKLDKDGNTLVIFTDGTQVTILKGQDGKAGVSPVITINADGYWVINGLVTNTKAKGEAGQNGQTPTVEIGSNGNWFINGKDTGVPAKGVDGQPGQAASQTPADPANPVNNFVKGILPATGSEQAVLLLMVLGSVLLLFGGYILGRGKAKKE